MNKPPLQWPPLPPDQPPRCLSCAYVLTGLDDFRCPECGRQFDPRHPSTYTTKPPFLAWKFWLPGLALAIGGAAIGAVALLYMSNWGWSLWFAVPFAAGSILGYRFRSQWWVLAMLILTTVLALCTGAMVLDIAGVFCGLVLAGLLIGPVFVGTVLGMVLRVILKASGFSQHRYLPVFVLMCVPIVCGWLEGAPPAHSPEAVSTSAVLNASAARSWDSVMFYEEVKHKPPFILRIGLAHPLFTVGSSSAVGDVKTCVYNKGRLVKRVTEAAPPRLLAFDVIEQDIGYERDVALRGGTFEFTELAPRRTQVTLTTQYTPLLTPRWAWRPFEQYAIHTLHRHVLQGMRLRCHEAEDESAMTHHARGNDAN